MENIRSIASGLIPRPGCQMPVVPPRKVPVVLRVEGVSGIHIGCCVYNCSLGKDVIAHAHISPSEDFSGWICFRSYKILRNTTVCLHELAHILSCQRTHNPKWRAKLLELGGSLESNDVIKSYVPIKRKSLNLK